MELRPHPDVVWRRLGDDVVLVQLHTNEIYSLNETAGRAWELLSAGVSRSDLERALLEEYDVDPEDLCRSVDELLEQLAQAGLVAPR